MLRPCRKWRMMRLHATPTPNPHCFSFRIPNGAFENFVPEGMACDVAHRGISWVHPLSNGLFDQYPQEVSSVFIAPRYVSITFMQQVEFEKIEWSVSSFLGHYLLFNGTCIAPNKAYALLDDDTKVTDNDSEVVQCIKELIREQVRPMVQADGGDVKLLNFNEKTGVVSLAMLGACRTCPSSRNTLKFGIERVMKHFLPEVTEVIEAKGHQFYEEHGLLFDSEKALYKEALRVDNERLRKMQLRISPNLLSYDALVEPDGDE